MGTSERIHLLLFIYLIILLLLILLLQLYGKIKILRLIAHRLLLTLEIFDCTGQNQKKTLVVSGVYVLYRCCFTLSGCVVLGLAYLRMMQNQGRESTLGLAENKLLTRIETKQNTARLFRTVIFESE